jgi:proteasome lid subunit RPN8/RPN11
MITLSALAVSELVAAHDAALPCEACGFLIGTNGAAASHVINLALPSGAAGSLNGFELADHEIVRVTTWAADRGLSIVAIFHSHPNGHAGLSDTDTAAIRYSRWPWVLITRQSPNHILILAFAAVTTQPMHVRLIDDMANAHEAHAADGLRLHTCL